MLRSPIPVASSSALPTEQLVRLLNEICESSEMRRTRPDMAHWVNLNVSKLPMESFIRIHDMSRFKYTFWRAPEYLDILAG
jgi:hypothetical protein